MNSAFNDNQLTSLAFGIIAGGAYGIYACTSDNPRYIFKNAARLSVVLFSIYILKGKLRKFESDLFSNEHFSMYRIFIWSALISFVVAYISLVLIAYTKAIVNMRKGARFPTITFLNFLLKGPNTTLLEIENERKKNRRIENGIQTTSPMLLNQEQNKIADNDINDDHKFLPSVPQELETNKKINKYLKNILYSKLSDTLERGTNLTNDNVSHAYKSARQKQLEAHLLRICEIQELFEAGTAKVKIRRYDEYLNAMVPYPHTAGPDISMEFPNMVQASLESGLKPVRYSSLPNKYLYDVNDEISTGKFDDCLTVCLIAKKNLPFLSIEMYVKDDRAIQLLNYLIKLGVINEICLAICGKIRKIGREIDNSFVDLEYCVSEE